ncbi:MAG TPA: oligoendopeptidase F [Chloroflexota bacterium]|nr:oligoendopeptidase F [Chloroflexota bacterium]
MLPASLPQRGDISRQYTWDLESIYATPAAWEADFAALEGRLAELSGYAGRLGASAKDLLGGLTLRDELKVLLDKLFSYAHMRHDEDTTNAAAQAANDRANSLYARFDATAAFMTPEIVALDEATVRAFEAQAPGLALYGHELESTLRQKPHVRSTEVEELLAQGSEVGAGAARIYDLLHEADMTFPVIRDADGQEVELTHGRYIPFQQSPDRRVREDSFRGLYATYARYRNTLAATYATSVKADIYYARAHNYASAQEAALFPEAIPLSVYSNLIETVEGHLDLLHRYLRLRKRTMALPELHLWDVYAPLVPEAKRRVPFEQAREDVQRALAPLGDEYCRVLAGGFASRWIDVYETPGKSSGAYSSGSYGTQPFILMNFQDDLDGAYTLAHELGHSMHSWFTHHTQPPAYADYSLFVAEVASTTNEALLTHHLLAREQDVEMRRSLVNNELEKYRGTLFRQTMFAHFEAEAHALAERGEALTSEALNQLYRDLVTRYFAPEVTIDDEIAFEWSRIPHFYRAFYVYQYATGISAAAALSRGIIDQGQPAVERYHHFLSAGGSDYPINLLREAGVDMTTAAPVEAALAQFEALLEDMEGLIGS